MNFRSIINHRSLIKGNRRWCRILLLLFMYFTTYPESEAYTNTSFINPFIFSIKQIRKKDDNKRISLNFQNISVRAALHLLAQFIGINLIMSDTVKGNITLNLHTIPWNQALRIILQTQGLGQQKIGNTLIIAPIREIAAREKEELTAENQLQRLEPLHSELIQINYAKASEIAALLQGKGKSVLSARGSVNVDSRTNSLWIQETTQRLWEIDKLVKRLDIPERQVLIEARIVNIDKSYEKELGVRWGISKTPHLSGTLAGASAAVNNTPISAIDLTKRLNVDLPAANVGVPGGATSVGVALVKLGNGLLLDMELSALQMEGYANIIANPQLITANQREALIEAGEEIPYQEATGEGNTAIVFKKAVLSLKVTPQITPDNRIILDLKVNQDKRGPEVLAGVPSIDTREIQTQVLINDGQTVVLGGIYQKTNNDNVNRVPFLGELPIIGHFFRHNKEQMKQTELLIFITPKVIAQPPHRYI